MSLDEPILMSRVAYPLGKGPARCFRAVTGIRARRRVVRGTSRGRIGLSPKRADELPVPVDV